jgi:hypothetical protein
MTVFNVFLTVFFLLISWLLCWEAYRGTEQDLCTRIIIVVTSRGYSALMGLCNGE